MSPIKAEARELLKSCENYIFEAGQADRQYRQVERGNCWKTEGTRGAQVHYLWKSWVFGWNDKGIKLYKTLRGCFKAIQADHWKQSWQEDWTGLQTDAPAKADEWAAGGGDTGDYEEECLPIESSD